MLAHFAGEVHSASGPWDAGACKDDVMRSSMSEGISVGEDASGEFSPLSVCGSSYLCSTPFFSPVLFFFDFKIKHMPPVFNGHPSDESKTLTALNGIVREGFR